MTAHPLVAALAAVVLAGCTKPSGANSSARRAIENGAYSPGHVIFSLDSPKLRRIRVAAVEARPVPMDEVVAPGKVEANPNRISRLTMPVPGRVARVYVRLGDSVTQGQPLWEVDSPDAGATIAAWRQAQSQSRVAASVLKKAQADLSRLKEMYAHRAAALKDVLAAQNDLAQAQAAAEQSETALLEAQHRLELFGMDPSAPNPRILVRAPISGKIFDISLVAGEYRTDTSAPVMTIVDLTLVWITAEVPESLIRHVQLGEGVEVTLAAYPQEVFRGRVTRIADTVDPQTRTVKVQAEIPNNSGRLRPEMFGQIRHQHGVRSLPVVPAGAVFQAAGKNVVWREERPGEFRQIEVQVGANRGDTVPILAGLKAGDRIVVDGVTLLRNQ